VKDGEIEREYTPAEFDSLSDGTRKEMGLRPFSLSKLKPANQYQAHTAKQMEFQNFCFAYKKREPESLHIPSAELPVGETIAIIGLNGAGKSTLARCICGLEKKCGLLQVDGKTLDWKARLKHCYMVMQDTSHQLFTESVTDEVLLSIDNEDETVVDKILKQFDLLEYKDRHPLSLSGGQKQRVAIASAIVSDRSILFRISS
ncbi:ATP-binding cassette domain-containing protein, partial [Faecalibacterium prausnitzii]|uniref:ATP-binding cassette domain-containing protein n=1 Tax=Faecalibacterium prausnitzii TaxID=853 RepID=UPI003F1D1E9E